MKKRRSHEDEEHIDESWLIPYSDLLTLLLALFIVLFASGSVNNNKLQQIMISMNTALNGEGSSIIQKGNSQTGTKAIVNKNKELSKQEEAERLQSLQDQIAQYIEERGLEKAITIKDEPKGIKLSLKDVILYESGSADLKSGSLFILNDLLDLIKQVKNPISIEGHTDNVPITGGKFKSNWELSSARALSVLYFFEEKGIPSNKLQFAGFGEQKPLFPNDSVEHRQANRRVDITILKTE